MRDHRYILQVPLARNHSVTIISNREMTIDAWRRLNRYLALQREILADDDASGTEAGTAEIEEFGPKGGAQ